MLFHVRIDVRIPHDLNPEKLTELSAREHERAKELQLQRKWLHLWRVAGKYANISIFDVESPAELHEILSSLPLYPFMQVDVAALCHHPGSLELATMSEQNKKIAIAFYDKLINEFDAEGAFAQYGGATYIQHTPVIEDGREGVTRFIAWLRENHPESHMEIKRAFSDGDMVILHSHWRRSPGDRGDAVVDFFRVQDGRVVEHWDVIQPIPATASNNNTMF